LQTAWCLYHLTTASPCRTECRPVRALPSPRVWRTDRQYYDPIRLPGASPPTSHSRLYAGAPRRAFFAGHRGSLQFPHTPSLHVAAGTPPVGTAVSDSSCAVPAAFARCRPSRPPDFRVTRLRLRSHYAATWSFANLLSRPCRRASPSCSRSTVPPTLRDLESVGLGRTFTDWVMRPSLDARRVRDWRGAKWLPPSVSSPSP
jgi:hypothetical protein